MRTLTFGIHGSDVQRDHVVALRVRAGGGVAISRGGCGVVQRQLPADAVRWAATRAIVGLLVGGLLARPR